LYRDADFHVNGKSIEVLVLLTQKNKRRDRGEVVFNSLSCSPLNLDSQSYCG